MNELSPPCESSLHFVSRRPRFAPRAREGTGHRQVNYIPPPGPFVPAWWLPSPHLQTAWSSLLRRRPEISLRRERLELPDGDFVDLDWTAGTTGPVVIVLHGLEGSSDSSYACGILKAIEERGWRGVLMHFRGASGQANRLPRSYHSGDTGDFDYLVRHLLAREPHLAIGIIGYSLGGNALLKWLGERGAGAPVRCAAAVSVPFELARAADRLGRGVSRAYQRWLLRRLYRTVKHKVDAGILPATFLAAERYTGFRAFDDGVTAVLHGFVDVDDYYRRSSSRQYLRGIEVPTLVLHARDDPFMFPDCIPGPSELPAAVTLTLTSHGGHVGFVSGSAPWRAWYWSETCIVHYMAQRLD